MFDARARREAPGLLASAWRFRWMSLIIIAQAALLGYASTAIFPSEPRAVAKLALADPRNNTVLPVSGGSGGDLSRYTANRAEFVRSDRVLEEASRLLAGQFSAEQLSRMVETSVETRSDIIRVSATTATSAEAADVANAVTTAYSNVTEQDTEAAAAAALRVIEGRAEEINRTLSGRGGNRPRSAAAVQTLSDLQIQANEVATYAELFGSGVIFVDPAKAETNVGGGAPSKRNLVIGALIGFLIALAVAWMRADRDQRINEPEEAADVLGAPLFGEIPDLHKGEHRGKLTDLTKMPAEPYQFATTGLRMALRSGVVVVVSADRHEGRTTTAASVAAGAAREGMRIALIDGDSRNQGLSRLVGVSAGHSGLTDVVAGRVDLESTVIPVLVGSETFLSVVPAGPFHDGVPSDFRSRQMEAALSALRGAYDLVIVDCPPLLRAPDAAALAGHADGVLAVVPAGSAVSRLTALRQQLDLLPTRLLGYVVTRPRRSRDVGLRAAGDLDIVESIPSTR